MSGLATSFNIKFLGSYVLGEHTVYVINPDGESEANFKKKTDKGSPFKTEAPLSRLSNKGSNDFGLSLNFKEGTMHYLKIKTGQEEALRSAMLEVLGEVRSERRPPSNWGVFFDRLKEVKQFDFEKLKDLWTAEKEVHRAAAEATQSEARRRLGLKRRAEAFTPKASAVEKVKEGVGAKRKREGLPLQAQEVPGSLLGRLPGDEGKFDFLLDRSFAL